MDFARCRSTEANSCEGPSAALSRAFVVAVGSTCAVDRALVQAGIEACLARASASPRAISDNPIHSMIVPAPPVARALVPASRAVYRRALSSAGMHGRWVGVRREGPRPPVGYPLLTQGSPVARFAALPSSARSASRTTSFAVPSTAETAFRLARPSFFSNYPAKCPKRTTPFQQKHLFMMAITVSRQRRRYAGLGVDRA